MKRLIILNDKTGDKNGICINLASFKSLHFVLLVLSLSIFLSSVAFAQTGANVGRVFGFSTNIDWLFVSYFVMLIVILLLGIAFMISRVFALRELEAWTKEEAMNVVLSIAILFLFTAFVGIVESLASSLAKDILSSTAADGSIQYWSYVSSTGRWNLITTSSPSCEYPCHIYIARGFLGSLYERYGQVIKQLSKSYFVGKLYEGLSVGSSVQVTLFGKQITFSFGIGAFPEYLSYNKIIEIILLEYLKIITAVKIQEFALVYLTSLSGLLFVIGIVSRSFWFLRKFGGLMIALGIGIYIFVPLMYVLAWYSIDRSTVTLGEPQFPEIDVTAFSISDPATIFGPLLGSTSSFTNIEHLYSEYDGSRLVKLGLFDALGRAYLSVIILPILAIFVTLGFVRHFSPMIGGDPEIAGLTRII